MAHDLGRLEAAAIDEHAYLDESWNGRPPGAERKQVRGQTLFAVLAGGDPLAGSELLRATPTSNIILVRSSNEAALGYKRDDLAESCWRGFHEQVLGEARPRLVLVHGVRVVRELARRLQLPLITVHPSGWGGTLDTFYAWQLPNGSVLAAIPNLSRYEPAGRESYLEQFFARLPI